MSDLSADAVKIELALREKYPDFDVNVKCKGERITVTFEIRGRPFVVATPETLPASSLTYPEWLHRFDLTIKLQASKV